MEPSQCKSVSGSLRMCVWVGGGSDCWLCVDVVEGVVSLCGEGTVC